MIVLVFVNLLKTITVSNYFYKAMTVGMRIRTGVASAIYQKSLKLSIQERKNLSGLYIRILGRRILIKRQNCFTNCLSVIIFVLQLEKQ